MTDWLDSGRVETMQAKGLEIVRAAIEQYKPEAIIAAFSGGNDSVVSTHFACAEFDAMAVHCDTGIGIKATREHVWRTAVKLGWALIVREAPAEGPRGTTIKTLPFGRWVDGNTAYEEYVFNNGFPGPAQHPRCYQRLKERQLKLLGQQLARERGAKILIISGIRADESAIRAGYRRAVQAQPGSKFIWVNPFYFHDAADFEAYRQEFSLPRNPVKATIGISGECLCGAFATEGEKELVRKVEPETAAHIDKLECRVREIGFPWGWGQRPPQWWVDHRAGQGLLFPMADGPTLEPMCVGCNRRAAKRPAVVQPAESTP